MVKHAGISKESPTHQHALITNTNNVSLHVDRTEMNLLESYGQFNVTKTTPSGDNPVVVAAAGAEMLYFVKSLTQQL